MGVLTQDMRDILASAMLAFVATVRRDGSPSLSPKASTIPYDDDHLLFVDILAADHRKSAERSEDRNQ
jgi:uncharacterized protein